MSCYLRHLTEELQEAQIELTPANRREVDQLLHELVGVPYKACPAAWRRLKEELRGDPARRADFVARLRKLWAERENKGAE